MSGYPFYPYVRGAPGEDAAARSDCPVYPYVGDAPGEDAAAKSPPARSDYPVHPYVRGAPGEDAAARYSSHEIDLIAARYTGDPSPHSSAYGAFDVHVGARRPAHEIYHQSIMGSHSTIGQSETLYSPNAMVKRPRLESSLPIYPYMRSSLYGEACKFDHPQWVPEGGIPNWKEALNVEESYPERPGEPDCPFFMKNSKCKFGSKCKYNHPKENDNATVAGTGDEQESLVSDNSTLPLKPNDPCPYYPKGKCKFRANCKFSHAKDTKEPSGGNESENKATIEAEGHNGAADDSVSAKKLTPVAQEDNSKGLLIRPADDSVSAKKLTLVAQEHNSKGLLIRPADDSVSAKKLTPVAQEHNSKGMPIRPGEVDCSFYIKTGSCMYGKLCRFNHPEQHGRQLPVLNFPLAAPLGQQPLFPTPASVAPFEMLNPPASFLPGLAAPLGQPLLPTPASVTPFEMLNPPANFLPGFDSHAAHAPIEPEPIAYPQRPGETACDFYMKRGFCNYAERCKFHHPVDRSAPDAVANREPSQQPVTLTLAGLPRRKDAETCAFYMKTGTCKFGAQCKFDHPPPGEAVAKVSSKQGGEREGGKKKKKNKKVVGLSIVLEK